MWNWRQFSDTCIECRRGFSFSFVLEILKLFSLSKIFELSTHSMIFKPSLCWAWRALKIIKRLKNFKVSWKSNHLKHLESCLKILFPEFSVTLSEVLKQGELINISNSKIFHNTVLQLHTVLFFYFFWKIQL